MRTRPGPPSNPFVNKAEAQGDEPQPDERHLGEDYSDDDEEYAAIIKEAVESTRREMLYVPPRPEEDPPELPADWSTIAPQQLQRLHGAFATFALRAGYLEKLEEAKAMICKEAADELFDVLFGEMDVTEKTSVTHTKAKVESDPNVRRWRKRAAKHTAFALSHKMDREGFTRITEALSRLHTMKQDEWVQAGGKSSTPK
jgi:hypothetical protein